MSPRAIRALVPAAAVALAAAAAAAGLVLLACAAPRAKDPRDASVCAAEAVAGGRYVDWARTDPAAVTAFREAFGLSIEDEFGIAAISKALARSGDERERSRALSLAADLREAARTVGTCESERGLRLLRWTASRARGELPEWVPLGGSSEARAQAPPGERGAAAGN